MSVVPGLRYYSDVISDEMLQRLITFITTEAEFEYISSSQKRVVSQFGYSYKYKGSSAPRTLERAVPIPDVLQTLIDAVSTITGEIKKYNQCIINRYLPGEGISQHTDSPIFGGSIACFSIGGDTTVNFQNPHDGREAEMLVRSGSLYIMEGESRDTWMHGIRPRKTDVINGRRQKRTVRYSITFRRF